MNILEIIVIGIIAVCIFRGYRNGFLRVVYSLLAWFVVLAIVTWSSPYIAEYLEENTTLHTTISQKCLVYIEETAEKKIKEQTMTYGENQKNELETFGIGLPESVIEEIAGVAAGTADELLESTGVYKEVADAIAHYIIKGISFFIALIIAGIISNWIGQILNLVSHLPILHKTNKMLGAGIGVVKGLVIVWLMFYIITLCSTSELGEQLLYYIKESEMLLYLYKNNILLQIIMIFL